MRFFAQTSALFLLAAFTAGCGGSAECEVSGTVTYDGAPIKQGGITFVPLDGASQTAGGMIQEGRYSCKLTPGQYKVVINGSKPLEPQPNKPGPPGPVSGVSSELLPPKYHQNSELTYEASHGKQEKNWDLAK